MKCEKRICLILDNYSVHKSAFIKKIAEILNIVLIYLPPYSPQLNPIEQLWRKMKRIIRKKYLYSEEYLKELTEKTFYECLIDNKLCDLWLERFITKKLGYNYSKAYPIFKKAPKDAEELLKKT